MPKIKITTDRRPWVDRKPSRWAQRWTLTTPRQTRWLKMGLLKGARRAEKEGQP